MWHETDARALVQPLEWEDWEDQNTAQVRPWGLLGRMKEKWRKDACLTIRSGPDSQKVGTLCKTNCPRVQAVVSFIETVGN